MSIDAEQIRMLRCALKLTIREFAELCGVDKMTIARLENGEPGRKGTYEKIRVAAEREGFVFVGGEEGIGRGLMRVKAREGE
ncbi:MAG: helix-turn-helix transcriptional regulator [Rhodomicrobium sp.]